MPTNSLIDAKKSDPAIKKRDEIEREREREREREMSRRLNVRMHNGWLVHLINIFSYLHYLAFLL